jgi:hypothetical protein
MSYIPKTPKARGPQVIDSATVTDTLMSDLRAAQYETWLFFKGFDDYASHTDECAARAGWMSALTPSYSWTLCDCGYRETEQKLMAIARRLFGDAV